MKTDKIQTRIRGVIMDGRLHKTSTIIFSDTENQTYAHIKIRISEPHLNDGKPPLALSLSKGGGSFPAT